MIPFMDSMKRPYDIRTSGKNVMSKHNLGYGSGRVAMLIFQSCLAQLPPVYSPCWFLLVLTDGDVEKERKVVQDIT